MVTTNKDNIRDLPLSGKWQSDLIQLEHRTPGVGVENGITPCRLSACSMLSSVEATLVGGLLPLPSQYRTDRGGHPAARARSACVSPASIRAARIWRPETMLLITKLYIRFWKHRHRSSRFVKSRTGLRYRWSHAVWRA